ncbi:MAG: hypothetical protein ACLP1X_25805 [Polyangiaceae bacterium]
MTPTRRTLVVAALGLCGCYLVTEPVREEEGALGNGEFVYTCVSPQDPACAPGNGQPSFPSEIALGGHFGLAYSGGLTVQPASTDWLVQEGFFSPLRVGQPWVLAVDSLGFLNDMLSLTIAPIASIAVSAVQPSASSQSTAPTQTFVATALDANGTPMGGDVLYSWASSDPTVVALAGGGVEPSDTITVQYVAPGTATLYAWTLTAQGSTTVTVPAPAPADATPGYIDGGDSGQAVACCLEESDAADDGGAQ